MWTTHLTLIKSLDHDFTSKIEDKKTPEASLDEEEDFASAFRLLHEGETFEEDKEFIASKMGELVELSQELYERKNLKKVVILKQLIRCDNVKRDTPTLPWRR